MICFYFWVEKNYNLKITSLEFLLSWTKIQSAIYIVDLKYEFYEYYYLIVKFVQDILPEGIVDNSKN
jgi:hypothetical protein